MDNAVKPDLLAVGTNVYTAAESSNPNGEIYARDGYADVDGTSFSAPLVAGAAALLKSARPGLTAAAVPLPAGEQRRARLVVARRSAPPCSRAGRACSTPAPRCAGRSPPLPFRSASERAGRTRTSPAGFTLTNVGTAAETYLISVLPRDGSPAPAASECGGTRAGQIGGVPGGVPGRGPPARRL